MKTSTLLIVLMLLITCSCKKGTSTNLLGPPVVVTDSATSITSKSFVANAHIVSDGGATITQEGFCFGTTVNPDTTTKYSNTTIATTYFTSISLLSPQTTYHVRAYAINSQGIAYGNDVVVTTDIQLYRPYLIVKSTDTGTSTQASTLTYDNLGRLASFNSLTFTYAGSNLWPTNSSTTSYTYDSAGNIYKSNDVGNSYSNQYFYTVRSGYIERNYSMSYGNSSTSNGDYISNDQHNNTIQAGANSHYFDMRVQSYSSDTNDTSTYTYTTYQNPLYNLKAVLFLINNGLARWFYSANLPATEHYGYSSYDSNTGGSSSSYTGNYAYTIDQLGRVITSKETCNSGVTVTLTFYY